MTTPLASLLVELFTDPDGRAALGDDPAATLADHGWSDLSPDDLADAVRLVTATGPAAAAAAGAEVPDESISYEEVLDGVLAAVDGVEVWTPEPIAVEAGSVEVDGFDFEPAPLSGTVLDGDDPFDPAVVPDPPPAPETDVDLAEVAEPSIDLAFGAGDDEEIDDPTEDPGTAASDGVVDDLAVDDALALDTPDGGFVLDDLDAEPESTEGLVELDELDPELPPAAWGDLDADLE